MDPAVTEWSVRTAGAVECGPLHRLNHSVYVKGLYVFHPISCSKQRQKKKNFFFVSFNDYFSAAFGDAHRISAEEIRN